MEPRHTTTQDHPFITTTFRGPNKSPDVFSFQTSLVRPPRYCDQRPPFGFLSPYFLVQNYPVNKTVAGERGLLRMRSIFHVSYMEATSSLHDVLNSLEAQGNTNCYKRSSRTFSKLFELAKV